MIDSTIVHFPGNIVNALAAAIKFIDPDKGQDETFEEGLRVFRRPLAMTDGSESVGIFPQLWTPDESSREMGRHPFEPTIQEYNIQVMALVIDSDEEAGIATHSVLSSKLRHMLYRDPALALALPQLEVSYEGYQSQIVTETLKRWWISRQTFMNTEYSNQFAYLSTVEFHAETELEVRG